MACDRSGTRLAFAGGVAIGGGARVTVQSMTNTRTADIAATRAQIAALEAAGCELVRFAVLDMADAAAVAELKKTAQTPLVADIHFDYRLAITCAENGADKLRINPGNIGAEHKVRALADCARAHGVPIRIGVNSGSVEKELLEAHGGPTPEALVESALGHARILERAGYDSIVLSVKSSGVRDTVAAYRMLAAKCDYPLHLGVTEAGGGEEALIKSTAGIGALLLDGIGDTIRISLTGDPVNEVRAGISLLKAVGLRREGLELISCPTCGRCHNIAAHARLCDTVRREFMGERKPLKVAVMGCAVNGPGEAREADIGIALGKTNAVLFERGAQTAAGALNAMEEEFLQRLRALFAGEGGAT